MIIDQKRKANFQTFKVRGSPKYVLHLLSAAPGCHRQWWNIPLEHGGKLAVTPRNYRTIYEVSFAKLPDDETREKVRQAVAYIETNGTPMENDEHIFGVN